MTMTGYVIIDSWEVIVTMHLKTAGVGGVQSRRRFLGGGLAMMLGGAVARGRSAGGYQVELRYGSMVVVEVAAGGRSRVEPAGWPLVKRLVAVTSTAGQACEQHQRQSSQGPAGDLAGLSLGTMHR